jgi:hypothetical protein
LASYEIVVITEGLSLEFSLPFLKFGGPTDSGRVGYRYGKFLSFFLSRLRGFFGLKLSEGGGGILGRVRDVDKLLALIATKSSAGRGSSDRKMFTTLALELYGGLDRFRASGGVGKG